MIFFMCLEDYYQILEVDYNATEENIKLSYKKLALVSYLCPCYVRFICYLDTLLCAPFTNCKHAIQYMYTLILWEHAEVAS